MLRAYSESMFFNPKALGSDSQNIVLERKFLTGTPAVSYFDNLGNESRSLKTNKMLFLITIFAGRGSGPFLQ